MNKIEKIKQEMEARKRGERVSPLEAHVISWLNRCHIFEFECEYQLGAYLCDLYFPIIKLVVELDGKAFHSSEERKKHDAEKDEFIKSNGLTVEHWNSEECWNPKLLAEKMIEIYRLLNPKANRLPYSFLELGIGQDLFRLPKTKASYQELLGGWVDEYGNKLEVEELSGYDLD